MKKFIYIFIFSLLFITLDVNAEIGTVKSSNGINMRESYTVDSSIIHSIANNAKFHISNLNGGTGNGCNGPWYYIYYKNAYGYVCSEFVTVSPDEVNETVTTYGRPWTSPKKSIMGGAEFISGSYIGRGQHTSYLKKFNVNPNAHYAMFTHQYMANLRAPSSEASRAYNALNTNKLLNYAYDFVIPVFLEMPESTFDAGILNTGILTSGVQDEEFEKSIIGFPETYKPYLRYLHSKYPLWTFTPLNTTINFSYGVERQKPISSIEISSGLCQQPTYVTEKGWCIAEDRAVGFFLDPRNFLSERYIFMFENLAYSDKYTETVVQAVINNTFMKDISLIDYQKYSSIFVEAGKAANVSPLYLAVLAVQESGVNGGLSTSGAEFEYEGYTYSNLYNFFNIGANSSASNPARAGLVYANGGKGFNNGSVVIPGEINHLNRLGLASTGRFVKGYSLGTNVQHIKNKSGAEFPVTVKNKNGALKNAGDIIATGDSIYLSAGDKSVTFTYVMMGDINGDGEINSADLLAVRQHLLGINTLKDAFLESSYITNTNEVNSANLLKLRQYLLGQTTINQ